VLVDTLGLILGVGITPASTPERAGAPGRRDRVWRRFAGRKILWGDGGDTGLAFAQWVNLLRPKLRVEVVRRGDDPAGFAVLPWRWVVARTLGWRRQQRRLGRADARTPASATAFIDLAMRRMRRRRLA
jgi:transposase